MFDKLAEHLRDSAPCASRWDGFDRGDTDFEPDMGHRTIGRMTSGGGYRVEIVEYWCDEMRHYEVLIDGNRVHSTDDRGNAVIVARWWMDGCPA